MAERPKRSLFGMDDEALADALESIYNKQKSMDAKLDELITAFLAMKTTVHTTQDPNAASGDEIPAVVKWALQQPWGLQLMSTITDKDMIGGLTRNVIEWLKMKAAQKVAEGIKTS